MRFAGIEMTVDSSTEAEMWNHRFRGVAFNRVFSFYPASADLRLGLAVSSVAGKNQEP